MLHLFGWPEIQLLICYCRHWLLYQTVLWTSPAICHGHYRQQHAASDSPGPAFQVSSLIHVVLLFTGNGHSEPPRSIHRNCQTNVGASIRSQISFRLVFSLEKDYCKPVASNFCNWAFSVHRELHKTSGLRWEILVTVGFLQSLRNFLAQAQSRI
jgi:hypothetical protein